MRPERFSHIPSSKRHTNASRGGVVFRRCVSPVHLEFDCQAVAVPWSGWRSRRLVRVAGASPRSPPDGWTVRTGVWTSVPGGPARWWQGLIAVQGSKEMSSISFPGKRQADRFARKTPRLNKSELAEFSRLLLEKRRELVGDVVQIESAALNGGATSDGETQMPIHPAELATDTWEQSFSLVLLRNKRNMLREIDEALERISTGRYGVCAATGRPIAKSRLRALPWTKYCIEYARQNETGPPQKRP